MDQRQGLSGECPATVVDSLRIKTGRIDLVTAHPLPYEDRSPGRMSGRVLRDRRDDAGS